MNAELGKSIAAQALLRLLKRLEAEDYHFVTPTPATHARVIGRPDRQVAHSLTDILGWSLPFPAELIDADMIALLREADALDPLPDALLRSRFRVSVCKGRMFLHSAYPTEDQDAIFFGPDSYRFADLIEAELQRCPPGETPLIVDIGTGAGVGAILAADLCPKAHIIMTDVNPQALRFARINAAAAEATVHAVLGEGMPAVVCADVIIANPPYIMDDAGRDYRDGGGMHGGALSLEMAQQALPRLNSGGRFILYTGSAIVDGEDRLGAALSELAMESGCTLKYREIDPDVFGEELESPAYADVDRIAIVAAVVERP